MCLCVYVSQMAMTMQQGFLFYRTLFGAKQFFATLASRLIALGTI